MGGDIQNTDLQHDSTCTARLDGLNRDLLRHNEGIWRNTSHDVTADSGKPIGLPARAYPLYTAPGMHHAVKVRYGVDNPGEVGSTAVFPPSWIRVNTVRKVANRNATLQLAFFLGDKRLLNR